MRFPAISVMAFLLVIPASAQDKLPEGPGKAALKKVCQGCHPTEIVASKRHTREEWETVITNMVNAGATGTDDEFNEIADYLTAHFAKLTKVNVNKAPAEDLVDALGIASKDASAIVAYREKNGPFKSLDDVKKVPGLDVAKIEAKKEKVEF